MPHVTCSIAECNQPVKRSALCYGHYMKKWRYGTPTPNHAPTWDDLRGKRFGTLVVTVRDGSKWICKCDCGSTRLASTGELNRYGSASTCGDRRIHRRTTSAGYSAAHQRCRNDRGLPHEHQCIDCGRQAQHWSYNHDDPNEVLGTSGRSTSPVAYSLDPRHYSPRCVPCHKRFDLNRADAA